MLRLKLDIMRDEAYNPRTEEPDNIGTLCLWHNRYKLGDDVKHGLSPREYLMGLIPEDVFYGPKDMKLEQMEDIVRMHYLFLPVYGYDHGGMSVSTKPYGDIWDSGRLGFIYCEKDKSEPSDDEARLDRLRIEVERYNLYLQDIAFCATTEIYDGDKLLMDVRSGTLLGFPEMYTLYDLMPLSHIHAFDEDFNKNKASWLPPLTKWAKLKDYKRIARRELEEAAKDIEEINDSESFKLTKNAFKDCRVVPIEEFEEVLARKGVRLSDSESYMPYLNIAHLIAAYFRAFNVPSISAERLFQLKCIALRFSEGELHNLGYREKGKDIFRRLRLTSTSIAKIVPEILYAPKIELFYLKSDYSVEDFCNLYEPSENLINLVSCIEFQSEE